jgi:TRAP-type C4-dicarboxylate transport system permease small subunit
LLSVAATGRNRHISVDVLSAKFSSAWQHILRAIAVLISFVIFSALAWRGIVAGLESITIHDTMMTMVNIPLYPFRLILAIGFISCVVALLHQIIQLFRSKTGDSREN